MIVYTYKEPLFCCSIVEECTMATASAKALILWDLFTGKQLFNLQFNQILSPLALTSFKQEDKKYLILQAKQGRMILFTVYQSKASKIHQYCVPSLGFTRLPVQSIIIGEDNQIYREVRSIFLTVRYQNVIEQRDVLLGTIKKEYETQTQFNQVNFLVSMESSIGINYFIAEEGGRIKKIIISKEGFLKQENIIELNSKEELKIILWMEVTSSKQAFVCLRNNNLIQINLQKMQPLMTIDLFGARIIKKIPTGPKQEINDEYAYSTKSEIGFYSNGKIRGKQKLDKIFILDLDVMPLGLVIITEEGKIAFLPRN